MVEIDIYTQPFCPYCARALTLLQRKGVAFKEIDAPSGSAARAEARTRSGRSSVPQIFIDGNHIGGCDDLVALDRKGGLDPLLGLSGAGAASGN
jgi:glutaredoxin 3